jgi:hypothetical protein
MTKDRQKDYSLRRLYGITLVEYKKMLKEQKGVCDICKRPPKARALSVDHQHQKQDKKKTPQERRVKVRGLLCWSCNTALAKFKDNAEHLRNAAIYIEKGFKFKT